MSFLTDHFDAILAAAAGAVVMGVGSALIHARTVGRMEATLAELGRDLKELKVGVNRVGKRFHFLNGFAMNLSTSVWLLCEKAGITKPHFEGYDFESEKDGDEDRGEA